MIIFFKNYKRTDRTLLSIQSIRYLFPEVKISCLNLYDDSADEYLYEFEKELKLFKKMNVKMFFDKKKWNFKETSAQGSSNNGYYFTEGINKIQSICKDEEKILIVDEDSFFTNGKTIQFLIDTDFDFAWADWNCSEAPLTYPTKPSVGINGSIIAINPKKLNNLFPIIEKKEFIEFLLGFELYEKCLDAGFNLVKIPTRLDQNFCGDGLWTNDISIIKEQLDKANIPYE